IARAAVEARISRLIEQLPAGYDTPVRRRGALFSPGERQRIAIARALLRDGRVWLLDEPTAGLDRELSAQLVEMLLERTRGRTTLWATHDPDVIPRLDRVLVLAKGRVEFFGDPREYARRSHPVGQKLDAVSVPQLLEG
ncbi:MAG TPA: ABC transporter ATP-binding protein, partial [Gemmatimonadaceae bacterium]|nr:ABC transporter ATP-binding protein [Gemmatimonadaceae bacterium]